MRVASVLLAALLSATSARTAVADDTSSPERLRWNEDWPRFRPAEYVATGVVGTGALAMYFLVRAQSHPHWVGGILFDDAVRNALRVHSASALQTVWAISDGLDAGLVILTVGVDSLAVPALRGAPDVSVQLGLMDAESFAFSSVVGIGLYDSVGRARPSYEDCQRNPGFVGCDVSPTASFPSGHTVEAFTSAGVSCANHTHLPIYGSGFWDALACGRDVVLATGEGMLRIIGDRHYATDVLTAAAIGFGFGYGVPTLLHYAVPGRQRTVSWTISPSAGASPGLSLAGVF
jgi:membrane-associated phospholipid phosphatase